MNPESAEITLGRTPAHAYRAAFWLVALGWGMLFVISRGLISSTSPLAMALRAMGIPVGALLLTAGAAVLVLALIGASKSLRAGERYRLSRDGFRVKGAYGTYTLAWENIAEAGVTKTGGLGIKVRNRDAVLATHEGTDQQREWLRTMEPWGEWDFLYPRADLGCPAEDALRAINSQRATQPPSHPAP